MLFGNFIKKKIAQTVIQEAIKSIPEIKDKVLEEIKVGGLELLNDVYNAMKTAVVEFFKKRHGK